MSHPLKLKSSPGYVLARVIREAMALQLSEHRSELEESSRDHDHALNVRAETEQLPSLRVIAGHARVVRNQGDCMVDTITVLEAMLSAGQQTLPGVADVRAAAALRARLVHWLRHTGPGFVTQTDGIGLPLTAQGLAFNAFPSWTAMCDAFALDGTWLENVALQAAASVLQRDIFVLSSGHAGVFSFYASGSNRDLSTKEAMFVGNWAMLHYVPMMFQHSSNSSSRQNGHAEHHSAHHLQLPAYAPLLIGQHPRDSSAASSSSSVSPIVSTSCAGALSFPASRMSAVDLARWNALFQGLRKADGSGLFQYAKDNILCWAPHNATYQPPDFNRMQTHSTPESIKTDLQKMFTGIRAQIQALSNSTDTATRDIGTRGMGQCAATEKKCMRLCDTHSKQWKSEKLFQQPRIEAGKHEPAATGAAAAAAAPSSSSSAAAASSAPAPASASAGSASAMSGWSVTRPMDLPSLGSTDFFRAVPVKNDLYGITYDLHLRHRSVSLGSHDAPPTRLIFHAIEVSGADLILRVQSEVYPRTFSHITVTEESNREDRYQTPQTVSIREPASLAKRFGSMESSFHLTRRTAITISGLTDDKGSDDRFLRLHSLSSLPTAPAKANPAPRNAMQVIHASGDSLFSTQLAWLLQTVLSDAKTVLWRQEVQLHSRRFDRVRSLTDAEVRCLAASIHLSNPLSAIWCSDNSAVADRHLRQLVQVSASAMAVPVANVSYDERGWSAHGCLLRLNPSMVWSHIRDWMRHLVSMLVAHPVVVVQLCGGPGQPAPLCVSLLTVGVCLSYKPTSAQDLDAYVENHVSRMLSQVSLADSRIAASAFRNVNEHPFDNYLCTPETLFLRNLSTRKMDELMPLVETSPTSFPYVVPVLNLLRVTRNFMEVLRMGLHAAPTDVLASERARSAGDLLALKELAGLLLRQVDEGEVDLAPYEGSRAERLLPPLRPEQMRSNDWAARWMETILTSVQRGLKQCPNEALRSFNMRMGSVHAAAAASAASVVSPNDAMLPLLSVRPARPNWNDCDLTSSGWDVTTESLLADHFMRPDCAALQIGQLPQNVWLQVHRQHPVDAPTGTIVKLEHTHQAAAAEEAPLEYYPVHERILPSISFASVSERCAQGGRVTSLLSPACATCSVTFDLYSMLAHVSERGRTVGWCLFARCGPQSSWMCMDECQHYSRVEFDDVSEGSADTSILKQLLRAGSKDAAKAGRILSPTLFGYNRRAVARGPPVTAGKGQKRTSDSFASESETTVSPDGMADKLVGADHPEKALKMQRSSGSASASQSSAAAAASSVESKPPSVRSPAQLYSSQQETGDLVLQALLLQIDEYVSVQKQPITDLRWHLVLPRVVSIRNQTSLRMLDAMGGSTADMLRQVTPPDLNDKTTPVDDFCKSAAQNPSVLHILMFDETHWGQKFGSAVHGMVSARALLSSRNLFMLGSTATPYVVAQHLYHGHAIVPWRNPTAPSHLVGIMEHGMIKPVEISQQEKSTSLRYFGLEQFAQDSATQTALRDYVTHVRPWMLHRDDLLSLFFRCRFDTEADEEAAGDGAEQEEGAASGLRPERLEEVLVALDYCAALMQAYREMSGSAAPGDRFVCSTAARALMKRLLERPAAAAGTHVPGPLCVIRLSSIRLAFCLKQLLERIRNKLQLQDCFEVCLDSSKHDGLVGSDHWGTQWRARMGLGDNNLDALNYEHLTGMPAILLLVNKCTMGDTLPSNFEFYDLRAKYCKSHIPTATAFEQDCGRAFGYASTLRGRPRLYVHAVAMDYMRHLAAAARKHGLMKPDGTLRKEAFLFQHSSASFEATKQFRQINRATFQTHTKTVRNAAQEMQKAMEQEAAAAADDGKDEEAVEDAIAEHDDEEEDDVDDDEHSNDDSDADSTMSESDVVYAASASASDLRGQARLVRAAKKYLARYAATEAKLAHADSERGRKEMSHFLQKRSVLISALPQLGKTGCYTYVLCRLMERFGAKQQLNRAKVHARRQDERIAQMEERAALDRQVIVNATFQTLLDSLPPAMRQALTPEQIQAMRPK